MNFIFAGRNLIKPIFGASLIMTVIVVVAALITTIPSLLPGSAQQQIMAFATIAQTVDKLPSSFSGGELPVNNFTATNTYLINGKTPQGGIDSFSYDGSGHFKLQSGILKVDVDPENNTGIIKANWTDNANNNNNWTFIQTEFKPTKQLYFEGLFSNGTAKLEYKNDSIAVNSWLHGNTKSTPPVLPTEFAYLATWGKGHLWKNNESQGIIPAHMMLTEGVRDPITGKVFNANQSGLYNPTNPSDGYADPNTVQAHLIIRSPSDKMTDNYPPQFEFTYHLMFYDIDVQ
ncbi:MAG: hypothetical protein R2685_09945 [Candidatus Nitrosocosmicus sp.]|nr:hypothetical protein [Candidatus Nitrosocosmicus sp.]